MGEIAVVTNQRAGLTAKNTVAHLRNIAGGAGYVRELEPGFSNLDSIASEIHDRKAEIVAIDGGDGTIHSVLTKLAEVYGGQSLPCITPLRGGTANALADEIGIKGKPYSILKRLVKAYKKNSIEYAERTALKVSSNGAADYGFIFATGMAANFYEKYYYGSGGKYEKIARLFWDVLLAPARFQKELLGNGKWALKCDKIEKDCTLVLAGTIKTLGFNYAPLERAGKHDVFHMIASDASAHRLLGLSLQARFGIKYGLDDIVLDEAVLNAENPSSYVIDGELKQGRELRLSLGPKLRIAKP